MNTYDYNNIGEWYRATYPNDEMGVVVNDTDWDTLWKRLVRGDELGDIIGTDDSVIRERVFGELASILGVPYNVVYITWMGDAKAALYALMEDK